MLRPVHVLPALLFPAILSLASCDKDPVYHGVPDCIRGEIATQVADSTGLEKVYEWRYDGEQSYLFEYGCCDRYNYLYSSSCAVVCAPSGGMTGKGDGQCPDLADRAEATLIWEAGTTGTAN